MQSRTLPSMVYITSRANGSPASQYQLPPTAWITAVNGRPTPTLDAFLAAVRGLPDNEYVRVGTVSFDGVPWVVSVKLCYHYWPSAMLVRKEEEEAPASGKRGKSGAAAAAPDSEADGYLGWRVIREL
jgi:hypothetical protein